MDNSNSYSSMRLPSWDYTQTGAYFITLGCSRRHNIFGSWSRGQLAINALGSIAADEWLRSLEIRDEIKLDVYVVMPNHFHGLVWIWKKQNRGQPSINDSKPGPPNQSLGSFVAGYKSKVTSRIRDYIGDHNFVVWQKNYYDQIIRNEKHLQRVRRYILNNPLKWLEDNFYSG